jgi:cell division protein FtsI/penicillin-binding protein 2
MILQHSFYTALAVGTQEVYSQLFPERGTIFIQDSRTGEEYPLAMNRDVFTVFADTRLITSDQIAEDVTAGLAEVFRYDDEKKLAVFLQLKKKDDPYEPLEQKIEESIVDELKKKDLPGIGYVRKPERVYPEGSLAAHVVGFLGRKEDGSEIGRYGVEGYWQEELAGSGGFFSGARSAAGRWIPLAETVKVAAEDGPDILLTIDRTLQFQACEILGRHAKEHNAVSASLIIMEPKNGAIRAMCNLPDFDPNTYNKVDSINIYNNSAIFTPYEPGSIFKPVVMAGAINEEVVKPDSIYYDSGSIEAGCTKVIKNAGEKSYEDQTMIGVLEHSINTGMVYVAKQLGKDKLKSYVEDFGFGLKEGIKLDSEVSGTIASLSQNKGDDIDCYAATASFGQGLTATPMQMVAAFGAIANGGIMMKPYVIQELRYDSGKFDRKYPTELRRVIETRAASLVAGMMVNVVDSGQAGWARVPGYYIAGKTGTAQIPGPGGYTEDTNHSFIGFGPIDDPRFVMIVKFEKPDKRYSASTAAPAFGEIAKFILQYYSVPPGR